jgi:mono/diheme cytochrome c family protein
MRHWAIIAASVLLTGCSAALAQQAEGEQRAGPPPQPAQAGPPAMPQPVTLAQRPDATGGEALYIRHCAMCHAANGMGTGLLARTRDVALLEARDNLAAPYVVLAARQGIGNMPAIPRGEVSDGELQAIAEYLAAGPHEVER